MKRENCRLKIIQTGTCGLNHQMCRLSDIKSRAVGPGWTIQHQKIVAVPSTHPVM
jgi:hypothetical protein